MKPDAEEALADIYEILQLTDDLLVKLSNANLDPEKSRSLKEETIALKRAAKSREDLLSRSKSWSSNEDHHALLELVQKEYLANKSKLRRMFKEAGLLLCLDDWQSPTYDASLSFGRNRVQEGIKEHVLDYKRDGHLEAAAYEERFVQEYARHLGSDNLKAFLTASGMSAFSTVMHFVLQETGYKKAACILPMYFENIHLARAFQPELVSISKNGGDLFAELNESDASVLIFDTLSNCQDIVSQDLESLVSWACQNKNMRALVIDATCTPTLVLPEGLLSNLPEQLSVYIVESLAKYHQFGMDIVTGGVVLLHGSKNTLADFARTRARFGANICDSAAASLPYPNRILLSQRLRRHSRNAKLIAEQLSKQIELRPGVVQSVSFQEEGLPEAPWFSSSCITLKFHPAYASIDGYREFEAGLLNLARERKHAIAFSTSFGFDTSRSYITAPASVFEPPFLRLALGTENLSKTMDLLSLLEDCSRNLYLSWKAREEKNQPEKDAPAKKVRNFPARRVSLPRERVFLGEGALQEYLNPANYAASPVVELPGALNPFKEDGVRILAKIVPLVPLMNIKSIPAYSMLAKASERGDLSGVREVIESSSSNTVLSLSVVAKLFGIEKTSAIVDHSIAPGLVRMLRLFGIEIFLHPAQGHELFGKMQPRSQRAAKMGSAPDAFNPNQYANPDNPEGFSRFLAPEIIKQTGGNLALLACALGTCGTLVGLARELRKDMHDLKILACCPQRGEAVPGPRERSLLGDVAFPWQDIADAKLELPARDSFAASVELLRHGIMAGPSSGMNYKGLISYLHEQKESGALKGMLDENNELLTMFICCDSPLAHVDEYFDALGDEYFPPINEVPCLGDDNKL